MSSSRLTSWIVLLLTATAARAEVTRSRAQANGENNAQDVSGPFTTVFIPGSSAASASVNYEEARARTEAFRSRLVAQVELEGRNTAASDCLVPRPVSGEATSTAKAFMFIRGLPRFRVTTDVTAAISFGGRLELAPPGGGDPTAEAVIRGNLDDADTILKLTNTQDGSNTEPRIAIMAAPDPLALTGSATLGFDAAGRPQFAATGDWASLWSSGTPETCGTAVSYFIASSVLIEITGADAGKLGTVELALKGTNTAPPETATVVDFRGTDLGARFLTDSALNSSKAAAQSAGGASLVLAPADAPVLLLLPGQNGPSDGTVDAVSGSAAGVPLLQLDLSAYTQDVTVRGLTLSIDGTIDPAADLTALRLYRDADGDGQVSAGDTQLAETSDFSAGTAALTGLSEAVPADADPVNWLVVADFAGPATTGLARRVPLAALPAGALVIAVAGFAGRPDRRRTVVALAGACLLLAVCLPAGCPQALQPSRQVTISLSLASDDDVSVATDEATVVGAPVSGATLTVTLPQ